MRSVSKLFALMAIVCIALSACQKEITAEDDPGIDPPAGSLSEYLDKLYYVDSTAGIKDTFRIVSYFYDARRRVTKIIDSSDVGPSFEVLPESSYEYSYNGIDTIPYKSLYQKYSWSTITSFDIDSQTIFHYYDASLNRVKDSIGNFTATGSNSWTVYRYINTSSSISAIEELSPGVFDTTIHARLDSRGNLILGESAPDGIFQYEFDNNPSPFKKLSNFRALYIWVDVEASTDFYLLRNFNNITKNTDLWPSQGVFDIWDLSGDYIYRTDGYPARIKDEYDPGEFEIIEFKYKAL